MTNDHFEPRIYSNTSEAVISDFWDRSFYPTTGKKYGDIGYPTNSSKFQVFSSALKGLNPSTQEYKDLTLVECSQVYQTDYVPDHRNLFLITKHSSNTTYNNTILAMKFSNPMLPSPFIWICTPDDDLVPSGGCFPDMARWNLTRGLPWRMKLKTVGEVEIAGCKSEVINEKCGVQFSLDIMIVVICCNFIKACCMIMTVVRSREPTLVTLGDAVDSFLRAPDPTTIGMCYADRQFIKGEWRAGPRQWKQKGLQRWWTSISKTRWITCSFFYLINIILVALLLRFGIKADGKYRTTDLMSMLAHTPLT